MMKKKIVLFRAHAKDKAALQYYLNEMAQKGWHLIHIDGSFLLFDKRDEEACYYCELSEDFESGNPFKLSLEEEKRKQLYEEMGYDFVCKFMLFQIYKSKVKKEDLHTDPHLEAMLIEKSIKRENFYEFYLPLILMLGVAFIMFCFASNLLLVLSNNIMLLFYLVVPIFLICQYVTVIKKRKKTLTLPQQVKSIIRQTQSMYFVLATILLMIVYYLIHYYDMKNGNTNILFPFIGPLFGFILCFGIYRLKSKMMRIIYSIVVVFIFVFSCFLSFSLNSDAKVEYANSIFSKQVMQTDTTKGIYNQETSLFLKKEGVYVDGGDHFFDYTLTQSDFPFVIGVALAAYQTKEDLTLLDTYQGCDVYIRDTSALLAEDMDVDFDYVPFLIIVDDTHFLEVYTSGDIDKARARAIIDDWQR